MTDDLRTSPRHTFPYLQLVASVTDGNMPSVDDFHTVPCEDVSGSGIAFFLDEEPEAMEYVVALGTPQNRTYVCARVVQVRQVPDQGRVRYRVGCQFTHRAGFERGTLRVLRERRGEAGSALAAGPQ